MVGMAARAGVVERWLARGEVPPRARWLIGAGLVAMLLVRGRSAVLFESDFDQYPRLGEAVLAGTDIYDARGNNWPPVFSLPCVPLAWLARLGLPVARAAWYLFNLAVAVWLLGRLAPFAAGERRPWGWRRTLAACLTGPVLLPLLLAFRFLQSNLDNQQVNLLLFALTAGGMLLILRGRPGGGGALIGVAGALKVMPLLFIPYLLLWGSPPAGLAAIGAAAAASVLPLAVFGWDRFWLYWGEFNREASDGWGVNHLNQSVYAMVDRFVGHGVRPWNAGTVPADVLPFSGSPAVPVVTGLVTLTFVGWALWAFRRRRPADPLARPLEIGAVFVASAIFCPLTWKAYLLVLLWPLVYLVAWFRRGALDAGERRVMARVLAGYAALALLPTSGLVGRRLAIYLGNLSDVTFGVLFLLGGLLWLRGRRVPPAPPQKAGRDLPRR